MFEAESRRMNTEAERIALEKTHVERDSAHLEVSSNISPLFLLMQRFPLFFGRIPFLSERRGDGDFFGVFSTSSFVPSPKSQKWVSFHGSRRDTSPRKTSAIPTTVAADV